MAKLIERDDIIVQREIGSGSCSDVYKSYWEEAGMKIALKNFKNSCRQSKKKDFKREVEILSSIQHTNLVRIFGFNFDPDETYIVEELMENGSLYDYARSGLCSISSKAPATKLLKLVSDVIDGMVYLHDKAIMHYDLKSRNILLSRNYTVAKINNFDLRNIYHATDTPNGPTLRYAAPEVVKNDDYGYESDIWSFGCVLIECITKDEPFKKLDNSQLMAVLKNDRLSRVDTMYDINKNTCPALFLNLVENCIKRRKVDRSSFSELREIINSSDYKEETACRGDIEELKRTSERLEKEIRHLNETNAEKLQDLESCFNNLSVSVRRQQPSSSTQHSINVFGGTKIPTGVVSTGEKYASRGSANNRDIYEGPRGGRMVQTASGKMRYI